MNELNSHSIAAAGFAFHRKVMEVGREKASMDRSDLYNRLQTAVDEFKADIQISHIDVAVEFADVHKLMGLKWHTELAFIKLEYGKIKLVFHELLLSHNEPHAGLIFVAKSWVLIIILERLMRSNSSLRREFIFEIGDGGSLNQVCFTSRHPDACMIVDYDFALSNGYHGFRDFCAQSLPQWSERINKIFWRGSTTGKAGTVPAPGDSDDFGWLQRLHLVSLCREPPVSDVCDVGISNIVQISEAWIVDKIVAAGLTAPKVRREAFADYRAVFDVDGNANAWSGLFCSLLSGSCVFKVTSPAGYRQWYYDELVAWKNFIPVSKRFENLSETVEWWKSHQAHAFEIAQRGRDLAVSIDYKNAFDVSQELLEGWLSSGGCAGQLAYA